MIGFAIAAILLQTPPSSSADACLAGGGAAGRMEIATLRGVRRQELVTGDRPSRVLVTITRFSPSRSGTASLYVDNRSVGPVRAGNAQLVSGTSVWISADPDVELEYCLRVLP